LGKGNIGTVTGELCQWIGMRVDFYQRWDDLTQKLKWKQVIINCLRHNITTTWIVNTNALQWFTWYYISAAGHKTENQQELVDLLKNGILQWFARDWVSGISSGDVSFPNYQKLKTDLDWYNTFITPAIASFTTNAIKYSNDICIENIRAYIQWNPINLLY
jgi:lactate dehydrogenase-like 2-hydroxyacid dehydrogenase